MAHCTTIRSEEGTVLHNVPNKVLWDATITQHYLGLCVASVSLNMKGGPVLAGVDCLARFLYASSSTGIVC